MKFQEKRSFSGNLIKKGAGNPHEFRNLHNLLLQNIVKRDEVKIRWIETCSIGQLILQ